MSAPENAIVALTRECDEASARMSGRLRFYQRLVGALVAVILVGSLLLGTGYVLYRKVQDALEQAQENAAQIVGQNTVAACRTKAANKLSDAQADWQEGFDRLFSLPPDGTPGRQDQIAAVGRTLDAAVAKQREAARDREQCR